MDTSGEIVVEATVSCGSIGCFLLVSIPGEVCGNGLLLGGACEEDGVSGGSLIVDFRPISLKSVFYIRYRIERPCHIFTGWV